MHTVHTPSQCDVATYLAGLDLDPSGELRAEGVTEWLREQPDYPLLLDLAQHGADLLYSGFPSPGRFPNRVPLEHVEEVSHQIRDEVRRGWLLPLPALVTVPTPNAPLQTRQEPAKVRRITDYSNALGGAKLGVNSCVQLERLGEAPMQRSLDLARAVRKLRGTHHHTKDCPASGVEQDDAEGVVMLVRDVSKAFRRIGVRQQDIPSLHFRWNGVSYLDTRLPFGHAASAHYCCKLTAAIAASLTKKFCGQAVALAYVDDFIIVSLPSFAEKAGSMFDMRARPEMNYYYYRCLADIGLPISASKADESGSWSPVATWIGFVHDGDKLTHALPDGKKDGIHRLARGIIMSHRSGQACTTAGLRTLCGKLSHVATVFTAGRAFLRQLQHAMTVANGPNVVLSDAAICELEWWLEAMESLPKAAAMRRAPCTHCDWTIVSDASLQGQGAVLFRGAQAAKQAELGRAHAAIAGRFSTTHPSGDMTLLEAWALWTALQRWCHLLRGTAVWAIVDNESLRWAIKKGRSKSPRVNSVIRAIMLLCLRHDIQLFPDRIQTDDNVLADELSRWDPLRQPQPLWTKGIPDFELLSDAAPAPLATKYDTHRSSSGRRRPGPSPSHGLRTRTKRCSDISPGSCRSQPAQWRHYHYQLLSPGTCNWHLPRTCTESPQLEAPRSRTTYNDCPQR